MTPASGLMPDGRRGWPVATPVGWTLAGLAVAWLLPLAARLVGAEAFLPVAVWLAVASLLRSGRALLDRLVLAAALLAGATAAAGLALSVWPWGLAPVPVAGTALSGVVLSAALLRRRPRLPLTIRARDLAAVGAGVLAALVVATPFLGADRAGRFALHMPGEDLARHFTLYDGIGIVDSYAFLARSDTDPYLLYGMQTYPQGSHFLCALLDSFLRSGVEPATALDSFDRYVGFQIAAYGCFALTVVWAATWVAGGALRGWPASVVYAVAGSAVAASELIVLFIRGYPGEVLGLTLLAVLLALCARPPARVGEQIVLTAAVLVGIGWAYFLWLPAAGLICVVTLAGYWRRARRHWLTVLVTAALATPLALLPSLLMWSARTSPLTDLLPSGPPQGGDRGAVMGIAAILLAGLAAAPRSPVWRMVGGQLAIVGGAAAALGCYQVAATGELSYYFDKAFHALTVTCLVGLGAITPLLATLRPAASRAAFRQRLTVTALVSFGILTAYGAVPSERPTEGTSASSGPSGPPRTVSWGVAHASGQLRNSQLGTVTAEVLRRRPTADGRLTRVIYGNRSASYLVSLFVTVVHRNQGVWRRTPTADTPLAHFPELGVTVADTAAPQRIIVVDNPDVAERLRVAIDARQDADVELISIQTDLRP